MATRTVINEGKHSRFHRHKWEWVDVPDCEWDENKYGGKQFDPIGVTEIIAAYRHLERCKCGAEAVVTGVGYI